jgi:hypothetical protein
VKLQAFLSYLTNGTPETALTKRLDHHVQEARSHIVWRKEYMTLLERDERMREEGREEERKNTLREKARADEAEKQAEEAKKRVEEAEKQISLLKEQLSGLKAE